MLGKIAGALIGEKLAGANRGTKGALIGAAVPMIARRGLGPLSLLLAAVYGARKYRSYRRGRDAT